MSSSPSSSSCQDEEAAEEAVCPVMKISLINILCYANEVTRRLAAIGCRGKSPVEEPRGFFPFSILGWLEGPEWSQGPNDERLLTGHFDLLFFFFFNKTCFASWNWTKRNAVNKNTFLFKKKKKGAREQCESSSEGRQQDQSVFLPLAFQQLLLVEEELMRKSEKWNSPLVWVSVYAVFPFSQTIL